AAPTLMRDTLYSIIMIVTGGLVGFSLLLGGRKFATQYMNLFGKISEVSLWRVFTASQACVMRVSLVQVLIFWKE
ncbi:hypothetical protein KU735_23320, partial [Salmonella enterica subsp. enterica serovar Give]|nr:hypothetical protein [Salmonella enterica subsp. enterica serovar Give]